MNDIGFEIGAAIMLACTLLSVVRTINTYMLFKQLERIADAIENDLQ